MEIEQYIYDLSESGEGIIAYKMISSSGACVELCNMGASLLSFTLAEGQQILSGSCVRSLQNGAERGLDEMVWGSRVETNRVVMSLEWEYAGANISTEVIFDFDDEDSFEITYLSYTDYPVALDLTHLMALEGEVEVDIKSNQVDGNIYRIDGAKEGILSHIATIKSAGQSIDILSSQPALHFEGSIVAPLNPIPSQIEQGERYIQKSLYRPL